MSLAAETRAAVRARPFLHAALRAGVVNFAAAARHVDVAEDTDAVATALRRYAADLPELDLAERRARVSMHGGLETGVDDPLLTVGSVGLGQGDGDATAIVATGSVDPTALAHVLGVLSAHDLAVEAAGVAGESLVVVVPRRDGPAAAEQVEAALRAVPTKARG